MEVEFILLEREEVRENTYEFTQYSLGLFEIDIIPRIGETVYYEEDGSDRPGFYNVKFVYHHIEPKCPTEILIISDEDEKYFDGKRS
jgi:hypothetical protein